MESFKEKKKSFWLRNVYPETRRQILPYTDKHSIKWTILSTNLNQLLQTKTPISQKTQLLSDHDM